MQTSPFQFVSGLDLIGVDGISEARSYPLGPNCRVPLFDKNKDVFYVKATDTNGFPSVKSYKYEEIILSDQENSGSITLNDIRAIMREEINNALKEEHNEQPVSEQQCGSTDEQPQASGGNSNAGSKSNNYHKRSTKPAANTSVVESAKEQ